MRNTTNQNPQPSVLHEQSPTLREGTGLFFDDLFRYGLENSQYKRPVGDPTKKASPGIPYH